MTNLFTGHRGASSTYPENTMTAFRHTIIDGCNAIELDVVQSSDGVPYIMHDDSVDRTTDGTGQCYELTWSTVYGLDAGSWKGAEFTGERVPKLETVIDFFKNRNVFIIVEIKDNLNYANLPQRVARMIQEKNMENQCWVMSFSWDYCDAVMQENHRCTTGLIGLGADYSSALSRAVSGGHDLISWKFQDINKSLVDAIHASGKGVNAWAVDAQIDIQNMIDLGVDSITGNVTSVFVNQNLSQVIS